MEDTAHRLRAKSFGDREQVSLPFPLFSSSSTRLRHCAFFFLSAAQKTGQGEESVIVVLVVAFFGGEPFFKFPRTVFWGVKRHKLGLTRGVEKQKHVIKKVMGKAKFFLSRKGWEKSKNCKTHV